MWKVDGFRSHIAILARENCDVRETPTTLFVCSFDGKVRMVSVMEKAAVHVSSWICYLSLVTRRVHTANAYGERRGSRTLEHENNGKDECCDRGVWPGPARHVKFVRKSSALWDGL